MKHPPKSKAEALKAEIEKKDQDLAIDRFFQHIDLDQFQVFLGDSDHDKYDLLLGLLHDPAYASLSFIQIARKAKVSIQELQEIYTNGMRHLALLRLSTALPEIMADVSIDARSTLESCPRCDGFTWVPAPGSTTRPCPQCKGEGQIRRIGDKHARDLVFETAKLTRQSGPIVAIQQNFAGGDTRLETMLKKTRTIVFDKTVKEEEG